MNDRELSEALCGSNGSFDPDRVEWSPCRCGGRVGIERRVVLHSVPPCAGFLEGVDALGIELRTFRATRGS